VIVDYPPVVTEELIKQVITEEHKKEVEEIASDLEAVSGEEVKPKKRATKKAAPKEESETKKTTKKSK
jgi:hypothetical protein